MFFSQRNSPPSFAFSVAHFSVDISILSKKTQLCCFFSLKVRVAKRFTAKTRLCLKCEILTRLHEGVDVRTDGFVRIKISWIHILFSYPWCCARESSAMTLAFHPFTIYFVYLIFISFYQN